MPSATRVTRRGALALTASIPLAGCTSLLGDDPLFDETVAVDEPGTFEAAEGDDLEVVVEIEESGLPNGMLQIQVVGITSRGAVPILFEFVDGEETFETTAETDGEHGVFVTNGAASVVVERA